MKSRNRKENKKFIKGKMKIENWFILCCAEEKVRRIVKVERERNEVKKATNHRQWIIFSFIFTKFVFLKWIVAKVNELYFISLICEAIIIVSK